jgi:hypothetical protein
VTRALYCMGGRRVEVLRVGKEFAVVLESGEVYGHRTTPDAQDAHSVAVAICHGHTPQWRPARRAA